MLSGTKLLIVHLHVSNLAFTKKTNTTALRESASFSEQPQLHQARIIRRQNEPLNWPNSLSCQEAISHRRSLGSATESKYNRVENLLKNSLGYRLSRESLTYSTILTATPTVTTSLASPTIITIDPDPVALASTSSNTVSMTSSTINESTNQLNAPLLITSPEITITRTESVHNLFRNDNNRFTTTSSTSTTSLHAVQQKLWNVVPLLRRDGSLISLYQNKITKPLNDEKIASGLKKCETVLTLSHSKTTPNFVEQIRPHNRLRQNSTIATCSRCSSILSLAANGSRYSLNLTHTGFSQTENNNENSDKTSLLHGSTSSLIRTCKLCLGDIKIDKFMKIQQCGCMFCAECLKAYVEFEIVEGAYEISCPDAQCPTQGMMLIENEIDTLVKPKLLEKYKRFRLNREIEIDKNRTWCPRAGCETVCLVDPTLPDDVITVQPTAIPLHSQSVMAVKCPTCVEEFCSGCKKTWHPTMTCEENSRRLIASDVDDSIGIPFNTDLIKCCPMCGVPIEKDEGCAQMMCKRCKHVFCWYCLASLDDDFLLRHYDKGPCKNKLGHSRASVIWHRAQVIGIFAGFGILLLVASPLLLLAAPCIVCCKCRICSRSSKLEDVEADFPTNNVDR